MKNLFRFYRLLNILSLDIVAGAVICASFFSRIFDITILPYGLISLGLTVWIIYTTDHLLDARKVKQLASTERHRFHQRHFNLLLVLLTIAIIVDIIQLLFIRKAVFMEGLVLASIVVLYFALQRQLQSLKELFGALLYSGGVLLIPLSLRNEVISSSQMILIVQFILTAFINLLIFSWFDRRYDEQDNRTSFTTMMGEKATLQTLIALFLVQGIFSLSQIVFWYNPFEVILVLMNGVLLLISIRKKYFEIGDRYRLLGDAIFLLPLIYLFMKLNGFDKIAAIYDRLAKLVFGRSIIHSQTYFLNRIPDDAKVLILGGGSGQLLTELFKIKPGIEVCYIEASSKMISLSGRRVEEGQRIKFIHGTEDNIPEGTRFDVIVTAFFLDLFSNESLRGVLMKITKSHATPCLWIVADFVNQKRWHASMLRVMYFFFRITSGVELKRLPEWERLIIESGGRELKSELFYNRFIKAALFQF